MIKSIEVYWINVFSYISQYDLKSLASSCRLFFYAIHFYQQFSFNSSRVLFKSLMESDRIKEIPHPQYFFIHSIPFQLTHYFTFPSYTHYCDDLHNKISAYHKHDIRSALAICYSYLKGYSVVTLTTISKAYGIEVYFGEVISTKEMKRRQVELYDSERLNYILSVKEHYWDNESNCYRSLRTNIDATLKGGLARYINHSCEPNCQVRMTRYDSVSLAFVLLTFMSTF